ncbi:MAG TPA: DUF6502 family protein [Steroidobacteraceae bacterium]|nr:DUF6502 family protein [Steroidobacteraceae bacterium]
MASKAVRTHILDALGRLLEPIVLLLLKSGITWREFTNLAKVKFVQVATTEFGIRGRPTNASRVAILTGIDRRDVRKLRLATAEQPAFEPGFMSKPTQVLDGWFHDPDFRTAAGQPRDLPASEGEGSFAALVRRYAPGIPHVAMIKELRAAGAIGDVGGDRLRALKRSYIPRELNENIVRLWGSVLQDVGTTLEHNLSRDEADPPRFERRALGLRVDSKSLVQFREMLEREGQAFLERIDEWISAHELSSDTGKQRAGIRVGVGVYHIQDRAPRLTRREPRHDAHRRRPGRGKKRAQNNHG